MADEIEALRACAGPSERQRLLGELFTRHRARLRALVDVRLDRRLRRRLDPSDVLQEAFVDAARRLEEYLADPPMPLFLWLRHLAAQRLWDLHERHLAAQRRSVRREVALELAVGPHPTSHFLAERLAGSWTSPSAAIARQEARDRLRDGLEAMDPAQREILVLRALEGLTRSEAARLLGISEEAAKKRYFRAMRRLREVLGDASPLEPE